ncbi:hypothetical protein EI71_00132 [Anaeroplasma bactoclasticum]|jgi:hypothetical protein|uniref:Uncharacterized protein n=2 Tax=Anaeroplasma bactoclasticum TaxID=2088 RepID=A0A397S749_9MOLU|nr:hypothetical protein EI71_00132 [Anaeroplasma bactoclasticum]
MGDMMKYGYVRELNAILLDKYNENEYGLTFVDYYMFQITSFGLSLFRELNLDNQRISLSQAFDVRCIIEALAVLRMYDKEEMPEYASDLLRSNQFICEYRTYKKYPKLHGITFDLEEMERNYNDAVSYYREKIGTDISSKDFKKIIKGKLPHLMEDYSYYSLISMYCPEFVDTYQHLSVILHPSEIVTNFCYLEIESVIDILGKIFDAITELIEKYYPNIIPSYEHNWEYECEYCFGDGTNYSPLVIAGKPQLMLIKELTLKIHEDLKLPDGEVCLPEVFFGRVYEELESILYDKAFGFSEIIKSKVKPIFELFATFHYSLKQGEGSLILDLMQYYTIINYLKVKNEPFEDELNKSYEIYKKQFNSEITLDKYTDLITKNFMPVYLGYEDIKGFVFEMIDDLVIDILHQKDSCKMLYEESQCLSHGNGYVLSSNVGAFLDSDSACKSIDVLLLALFKEYAEIVKKNNLPKKLKYDIKSLLKKYEIIHTTILYEELTLKPLIKKLG